MITAWSFSRLKDFEKCPYMAWLKVGEKRPQDHMDREAADRGSAIHKEAEDFVRGKGEFTKNLSKFRDYFADVKAEYDNGTLLIEDAWGFDNDWIPAGWWDDNVWCRMKLDNFRVIEGTIQEPIVGIPTDYKGLALDTRIPTATGWETMESISVGERVFSSSGKVCNVIGKSTVKNLSCYKITFDDASSIICDEVHKWKLSTGEVVTTTALKRKQKILTARPAKLPVQKDLLIDPYVMGIWLAGGKHTSGKITNPDREIWDNIKAAGYKISHDYSAKAKDDKCRVHTVYKLRGPLNKEGVLGDKHIPQKYLRASYSQRLALLQGLFDGDGTANIIRNQVSLYTVKANFAKQVRELALSLGQRAIISKYTARGSGKVLTAYEVVFRPTITPFRLSRKQNKVMLFSNSPGKTGFRQIKAIEAIESVPTQCIAVDSDDNTFLCGEQWLPTHNTGKKFNNEVAHNQQGQLYALGSFLKYPSLETATVEFKYLDHGIESKKIYTREKIMKFLPHWTKRAKKLTEATDFPPKPNKQTCMWCAYGPQNGDGSCDWGV